jgi:hypothetical protein
MGCLKKRWFYETRDGLNSRVYVSNREGTTGAQTSLQWEVKPTMPTSQCGRQSSWFTSSADHLVRLEEERRRDGEAQGLGGLEVDDQLERRGLLHGQVGGRSAFEDFVHVRGGTPIQVRTVRAVGHQGSLLLVYPDGVECPSVP